MELLSTAEALLATYGGLHIIGGAVRKARATKVPDNMVAKIYLKGEIHSYSPRSSPLAKKTNITPEGIVELVEKATADGAKGFVFDIDSPGGAVAPSKEIGDYLLSIKLPKVARIGNMGASGAYWAAVSCDHIVVNPFSVVGSIGVRMDHLDFSGLASKLGIRSDGITSGEYKGAGGPFQPLEGEIRSILQSDADDVHAEFIAYIAERRSIPEQDMRKIANGLTYFGKKAVALKLADEIGNSNTALEYLKKRTGREALVVKVYEPKTGFLGKLTGTAGASAEYIGSMAAKGFLSAINSRTMR